ncbi:Six-hairpin glycosidase [Coniochaeta sp. PMI_546]|nr:Six-hairpin glycosidase [Coniochaeta sp. PMI_546]
MVIDLQEPSLDSFVLAPNTSTPSASPNSSTASSSEVANGSGVSDDSVSSVSGNASIADISDHSTSSPADDLRELFEKNILAKICRVAMDSLSGSAALVNDKALTLDKPDAAVTPPAAFPEYCPQEGDSSGKYILREAEFWTCGFFPGTLYTLLERVIRFPHCLGLSTNEGPSTTQIRAHLTSLCQLWSEPLHDMASRTDTHDIGFIIMPALRMDWELTSNPRSLASIVQAACSLATRYVPTARAIRSWDLLRKKDVEIVGMEENMILIIDSMCNLDLLYYAAAHSGEAQLADMATAHARTLLTTHLRPELARTRAKNGYTGQLFSTWHVANLDPRTGGVKRRLTAQGYADDSTWARGQSWAILGYAQTYMWTKDPEFLSAACGAAEYFLYRLDTAPECVDVQMADEDNVTSSPPYGRRRTVGRYVPLWDFDAPIEDETNPIRDSSAAVIAANGMLVLSQALAGAGQVGLSTRFRDAAIALVRDSLDFALAREKARFVAAGSGVATEDVVETSRFDALLKYGTANNNANARKRYANHGLVYGDYYLVEFGNRMLRMGLV